MSGNNNTADNEKSRTTRGRRHPTTTKTNSDSLQLLVVEPPWRSNQAPANAAAVTAISNNSSSRGRKAGVAKSNNETNTAAGDNSAAINDADEIYANIGRNIYATSSSSSSRSSRKNKEMAAITMMTLPKATTTTTTALKGRPSQQQSQQQLLSNDANYIQHVIIEAQYEAHVNPYRGIPLLNNDNNESNIDTTSEAATSTTTTMSANIQGVAIVGGNNNSRRLRKQQWQCGLCTLLNSYQLTNCEVCRVARTTSTTTTTTANNDDDDDRNDDDATDNSGLDSTGIATTTTTACDDGITNQESTTTSASSSPWMKCCTSMDCSTWILTNIFIDDKGQQRHDVEKQHEGNIDIVNIVDDNDGVGVGSGSNDDVVIIDKKNEVDRNQNSVEQKKVATAANILSVKIGCRTVDDWANIELDVHRKQLILNAKKDKTKNSKSTTTKTKRVDHNTSMNNAEPVIMSDKVSISCSPSTSLTNYNSQVIICGKRKHDNNTSLSSASITKKTSLRPTNTCDTNPFCLASLGGIIDVYRECAAKVKYAHKGTAVSYDISKQINDVLLMTVNTTFDDLVLPTILSSSDMNTNNDEIPSSNSISDSMANCNIDKRTTNTIVLAATTTTIKSPIRPKLPKGFTECTYACLEIGEGWTQQLVKRKGGFSNHFIDRYFFAPKAEGGRKFRSMTEVNNYLNRKSNKCRHENISNGMKGAVTNLENIRQPVTNDNKNAATATESNSNSGNHQPEQQQQQHQQLRGSHLVNRHDVRVHVSQFLIHDVDCSTNNDDGIVTNVDMVDNCDTVVNEYLDQIESCHQSLVFCPSLPTLPNNIKEADKEVLQLSMPAGLRNLGATCYLNSQLQCLAQNLGFMSGLLSLSRRRVWDSGEVSKNSNAATTACVDERMSSVLFHMQSILARLRYGPERVICTNDFAFALGLENNVMQDPNEFARLLFDRMAESFHRSDEISDGGRLDDLLPSVFGGTVNYVTRCCECGHESTRSENFMEISLPIVEFNQPVMDMDKQNSIVGNRKIKREDKKSASTCDVDVQQCIDFYLRPESLDGDNQYECFRCKKKVDATRRMDMARLSPVLNIQLARYIFDRHTFSKRKLMTKVLLPRTLDVSGIKYILCAVQDHLGTSAHGGHYTADVMDWKTGMWYKFNDEKVTILGSRGPCFSFEPENDESGSFCPKSGRNKFVGSQDAYNLLYVQEKYLSEQCGVEMRTFIESETNTMDGEGYGEGYGGDNVLSTIKVQRNKRYEMELELLTKKRLKDLRLSLRREQIIKELLRPGSLLISPTRHKHGHVWIPSKFLVQFFSCDDDMEKIFRAASNTIFCRKSFICQHSRGLDPRVARGGKLLPSCVYDRLEAIVRNEYSMFMRDQGLTPLPLTLFDEKYIVGVNLSCHDCGASYQNVARNKIDIFTTLVRMHDELIPGSNDLDQSSLLDVSDVYAISRTWVTSFKAYVEKLVSSLSRSHSGGIDDLDLSSVLSVEESNHVSSGIISSDSIKTLDPFKGEDPTSKITCKHGCCHLMHNSRSVRLISGDAWRNIKHIFTETLAHPFTCKTIDATGNCELCHAEVMEERLLPQKLSEWTTSIAQSQLLFELRGRGIQTDKLYPSEVNQLLQLNLKGPLSLRILSQADVQIWRDCIRVVEKAGKKNTDVIRKQLSDIILPKSSPFRLELICEMHQMTINVPSLTESKDVSSWLDKLNRSSVELLLIDEHDGLLLSIAKLESILRSESGSKLPVFKSQSPPSISISLQEGKLITAINPQTCRYGCTSSNSDNDAINSVVLSSQSGQSKRAKLARSGEVVNEVPKGPLCKAVVHQVENATSIEVAASSIMINASIAESPLLSATGRPRRSCKARGTGVYSVEAIEMALDGNLAHLRLLLHQLKGKKLYGQRLFLLFMISTKVEVKELTLDDNLKTMHDLAIISAFDSNCNSDYTDSKQDCTIYLVLSYDDVESTKSNNSRIRHNQEEKDEDDYIALALSDIACGGWKTDDVSSVKQIKRQRQERGFQGTFLQSTQQASVAKINKVDDQDRMITTELENLTDNVSVCDNSIVDMTIDEGEYMTKNVEMTEDCVLEKFNCKADITEDEAINVHAVPAIKSNLNIIPERHDLISFNDLTCHWCAKLLDTNCVWCKSKTNSIFLCSTCKTLAI